MGRRNFNISKIISTFYCIFNFVLIADSSHRDKLADKQNNLVTNKVNLSEGKFLVEWNIDQNAECIEFNLNVTVDEKGWVFFGFMPLNNTEKPRSIQDTKGDFVLTWISASPSHERKTLDLNTIKTTGNLEIDDKNNYQVIAENSTENSSLQVIHIKRKLDTGDPQDVPITDHPMWMFGAWGTSGEFINEFTKIKDNINVSLRVEKAVFMKKNKGGVHFNKVPWKVLKEQMKKHWIGVVVGSAALLTMSIVAVIYLCTTRGKINAKKIKMAIYKEDKDDEARVAFLHSRT